MSTSSYSYRILSIIRNSQNNRSMHSPDRLGIDYICIAPIDYLWLDLKIDSIRYPRIIALARSTTISTVLLASITIPGRSS